jgi:hypothetical protein
MKNKPVRSWDSRSPFQDTLCLVKFSPRPRCPSLRKAAIKYQKALLSRASRDQSNSSRSRSEEPARAVSLTHLPSE